MAFRAALEVLRAWKGDAVVVHLEPEGTVMTGRLAELDARGVDGALFAVDPERRTGVALALFRDGVDDARRDGDRLVIRQGRVTITVTRGG